MPDFTADYTIASTAAEAELWILIKQFVPHWAQDKIPADMIHKGSIEVGKAVVDALAKAHAQAQT